MLKSVATTNLKNKILFQMTGSIACYKACQVISQLIQSGYEVQVVTSNSTSHFIGNATLEGLTGRAVISDLWKSGNAMDHIHLMRWCDLTIVAPATANYINKISQGVGDDLLTTMFLAHDFKKPFLIAPAMNTTMYLHPVTKKSIASLKSFGLNILETASGVLACGETGYGKLLEPNLIVKEIESALGKSQDKIHRVLVTAGGTQEPIDSVRVIANKSTGSTGAQIANSLSQHGFAVTFLHSTKSALPKSICENISFESFQDLEREIKNLIHERQYEAIIHTAAVSDFSVLNSRPNGKFSSDEEMTLKMKKNPKIINSLRQFTPTLIAFKMTSSDSNDEKNLAIQKLFSQSSADLIIHNDTSEIDLKSGTHIFHWCEPSKDFSESEKIENTNSLAIKLREFLTVRGLP